MSEQTGISWTGSTWNPWHGCHKVSAGCKNCYMFRDKEQYGQDGNIVVRSKTKFNDPLKWVKKGNPPKLCFTCSWSDFFIEEADPWRNEAWDIIRRTPQITYQILTKRPQRIIGHLPVDWNFGGYPNVQIGVSIEDQKTADERIVKLLLLQFQIRTMFVSYEPALAEIDISRYLGKRLPAPYPFLVPVDCTPPRGIDWLIVGGESGNNFRPMNLDWLTSIVNQCKAAGVKCFVKQDSGRFPGKQGRIPDQYWKYKEFPGGNDGKSTGAD